MTDPLPTAIKTSVMKIADLELTVHQLDDGRRVIDAESMARFIEWMEGDGELPSMKDVTP